MFHTSFLPHANGKESHSFSRILFSVPKRNSPSSDYPSRILAVYRRDQRRTRLLGYPLLDANEACGRKELGDKKIIFGLLPDSMDERCNRVPGFVVTLS